MIPKIKTARFVTEFPQSGNVEYRPFFVKEEGAILTATEFGKKEDLIATLKDVVQGCILNGIQVDDMLMIEFVYLIILLRTKSKSAILELITKCTECKQEFSFQINLDEKEFFINKDNIKILAELNDDLSIEVETIRAKNLGDYFNLEMSEDKIEATLDMLSKLVTKFIYEKKVYNDFTSKEIKDEVLSKLTTVEFEKLTEKMGELIKFELKHTVVCEHCNHEDERVYDDPLSFLA